MFSIWCVSHNLNLCNCLPDKKKILINKYKYEFGRAKYLNEVSSTIWNKEKNNICNSVIDILEDNTQMKNERKNNIINPSKDIDILLYIYNLLDNDKKNKVLQQYPEFINKTCSVCLDIYKHNKFKKCIHLDCNGMCNKCYDKWKKINNPICIACNKIQELECPVCIEITSVDNLVNSFKCEHVVCWKCYGTAFQSTSPIIRCPKCRKQFNEKWSIQGEKLEL